MDECWLFSKLTHKHEKLYKYNERDDFKMPPPGPIINYDQPIRSNNFWGKKKHQESPVETGDHSTRHVQNLKVQTPYSYVVGFRV
jgi:hypothetical protein